MDGRDLAGRLLRHGAVLACEASESSPAAARERSDSLLARWLDPDEPGCSAAVAIEGEIAWSGARVVADLSTGAPITAATRFDLASVSKQFTATAVLLLELEGALALSDRLVDHLDGLPSWAGGVTIADLMHHTSGIPDYTRLLAGISDTACPTGTSKSFSPSAASKSTT